MELTDIACEFVRQLLKQTYPTATLVEFLAAPAEHYTLRIGIPGQIGKAIILSRTLVDRAPNTPAARRSLLSVLRSDLLQQRAYRAQDAAREERAAGEEARAASDAFRGCAGCGQPVGPRERVVVRRAQLLHAACAAWRPAG